MVEKVMTRADEVELEHDFEWVNAWAAAVSPTLTQAAPVIPTEPAAPTIVAAQEPEADEPAQADRLETVAAPLAEEADDEAQTVASDEASSSDGAHPVVEEIDPAACMMMEAEPPPIAPLAVDTIDAPAREDADMPAAASDQEIAAAALPGTIAPAVPTAPRFDALQRLTGRRWKDILHVVVRNPEPTPAHAELVAPGQQHAPEGAGGEQEALSDERTRELTLVSDQVSLVPDQLERDIAEIEMVRDRLYAEYAAERDTAARRFRTSDYVPILVGAALAFTLLVVFGAAASFVSLR
jgi:hypothetical protein